MIDATTFANSYNAFWNAYSPTCEHFIRRLNLVDLKRFDAPMGKSSTSKRRAVIAEYAFSIFVERMWDQISAEVRRPDELIERKAWSETRKRLVPYAAQGLDLDREIDAEESREVSEIAKRLSRFFSKPTNVIHLRPIFRGCGFVDASEGDVVFDKTIYEIKTVERPFRSSDIRQTLTYAALNFVSEQFKLEKIGLLNPRRGEFCDLDLRNVCSEISGRPAEEFLAILVRAVSSGEISR